MAHSEPKNLVDLADKVQKRLNLVLQRGPKVPKKVEDYPNTNQPVLFVIRGEHLHRDFQEVLNKGTKNLTVRKTVKDLNDDVPQLVLGVIDELRLGDPEEDH